MKILYKRLGGGVAGTVLDKTTRRWVQSFASPQADWLEVIFRTRDGVWLVSSWRPETNWYRILGLDLKFMQVAPQRAAVWFARNYSGEPPDILIEDLARETTQPTSPTPTALMPTTIPAQSNRTPSLPPQITSELDPTRASSALTEPTLPPPGETLPAQPTTSEIQPESKRTHRPKVISKIQKAIVILKFRARRQGDSIRVEDIAAESGCSPQNLYKSAEFQQELKRAQAQRVRRGWKIEGIADSAVDSSLDDIDAELDSTPDDG
jgi:hypothetical protein